MRALLSTLLLVFSPFFAQARQPEATALEGDVLGAHDPSMIQQGKTWYVFTTGRAADGGQLGIRCSEDLRHWRHCGHVFDGLPAWVHERSPGTRDLWAPDISYEHGEYRLYYAYSLFGKNTSGIGLVTNETLDPQSPMYHWNDVGFVFASSASDDFNAIDANYIEDASHRAWLAFGSFWGGIKMRALDANTGKLSAADTQLYALAARVKPADAGPAPAGLPGNWQAVEAPFLFRHGKFFYLFVSFDLCCRGTKSTYRTMVGRATSVTGPFVDRAGVPMLQGGGTPLLAGGPHWLGPGGESVVAGRKRQPDLIVYHAYDAVTGKPSLQISTLTWEHDWPAAALAK